MTAITYVVILLLLLIINRKIGNLSDQFDKKWAILFKRLKEMEAEKNSPPAQDSSLDAIKPQAIPVKMPEFLRTEPLVEEKPEDPAENQASENPILPNEPLETPPTYEEKRATKPVGSAVPESSWWESFSKKHPDLENFIGVNLVSKIGIAILVLGIAFFVKYAIDKNWINESARVGIGILAGVLINALAHRLRKSLPAFSSVLVAGAISVYYFTIAIAFQDYHLFSQTTAFIIMILITGFSILVSVSYDRQELALLSLLGGFATPLMLSTGQNNYITLFSYLLILDIGILLLAYFRNWKILKLSSYVLTMLYFVYWVEYSNYPAGEFPYGIAFLFACLFYVLYTVIILLNNIVQKRQAERLEYALFLSNTALFYALGMYLLNHFQAHLQGLFTALLAVFNLLNGYILYKKLSDDKLLIYLVIGLALSFATLAAPVQLEGNHITLFWAAESALLLWLSFKSAFRKFLYASVLVSVLMIGSLLIDWFQYYSGLISADLNPILNKICLTGCFAVAALFLKAQMLKRHQTAWGILGFEITALEYSRLLHSFALGILYAVGFLELNYQCAHSLHFYAGTPSYLSLYHFAFASGLIFYFSKNENPLLLKFVTLLSIFNVFFYALFYMGFQFEELRMQISTGRLNSYSFQSHFPAFAFIAYNYYMATNFLSRHKDLFFENKSFIYTGLSVALVAIFSSELLLILQNLSIPEFLSKDIPILAYQRSQAQIIKIGFPILWGCLSVVYLIRGIRKQNKTFRVFALVLQAVTIIKLFTYDIRNVSEAGKIIAFILLGVLLLIMSFMYQKIKVIIFSNDEKES